MRVFVLGLLLGYALPIFAEGGLFFKSPLVGNPMQDGKMHIYLCGTGSPEVEMQPIRKPACLAVVVDNQFILFDAGEGAIQTLASMGLPYRYLDNVFLTHLHSDHIGGLGQVLSVTWDRGPRDQPLNVYGPYGVKQIVHHLREVYRLDTMFHTITTNGHLNPTLSGGVAHLIEASAQNQPVVFKTNTFSVTAFPVDHEPVYSAFGYKLQYKGCTIVISGDTKITETLKQNAKDANLLINESLSHPLLQQMLANAQKNHETARYNQVKWFENYHSDSWELAKMAQEDNVKTLVLTHYVPPPTISKKDVQEYTAGMNKYYHGQLIPGADRDEIVIQSDGANHCTIQYKPANPVK